MTQLSFMSGAAVAFILALIAGASVFVPVPSAGISPLLQLLASILGFLYLVWLIRGSQRRSGRLVALAFWGALSVGCWILAPTLSVFLLVHITAIWLIRSCLVYSGLLPALLDLALTAVSTAAAGLAFSRSGSVFLTTWCFFLLQALFVSIPIRVAPEKNAHGLDDEVDNEPFERAKRRGEAALEQLFTR
ncbi:MAG: hypothetical protein WDZ50_05235 [Woeseia sp.]